MLFQACNFDKCRSMGCLFFTLCCNFAPRVPCIIWLEAFRLVVILCMSPHNVPRLSWHCSRLQLNNTSADLGDKMRGLLLLREDIRLTTWYVKNPVTNGINYLSCRSSSINRTPKNWGESDAPIESYRMGLGTLEILLKTGWGEGILIGYSK